MYMYYNCKTRTSVRAYTGKLRANKYSLHQLAYSKANQKNSFPQATYGIFFVISSIFTNSSTRLFCVLTYRQ